MGLSDRFVWGGIAVYPADKLHGDTALRISLKGRTHNATSPKRPGGGLFQVGASLAIPEVCIFAVGGYQVGVRAIFRDFAVVEDCDPVKACHG